MTQLRQQGVHHGLGLAVLASRQVKAQGQQRAHIVAGGLLKQREYPRFGVRGIQHFLERIQRVDAFIHGLALQPITRMGIGGPELGKPAAGQRRAFHRPQFPEPGAELLGAELGFAAAPAAGQGGAEAHLVIREEARRALGLAVSEIGQEGRPHGLIRIHQFHGQGQAPVLGMFRKPTEFLFIELDLLLPHESAESRQGLGFLTRRGEQGHAALQPGAVAFRAGMLGFQLQGQGEIPHGPGHAQGQKGAGGFGAPLWHRKGQVRRCMITLAIAGQGLQHVPGLPGAVAPQGAGQAALVAALADDAVIAHFHQLAIGPCIDTGAPLELGPGPAGVMAQHLAHGLGSAKFHYK